MLTRSSANFKIICLLLLSVWLLFNCGGTQPPANNRNVAEPVLQEIDESFDPVLLNDEDIEFPENNFSLKSSDRRPIPNKTQLNNIPEENQQRDGWRVQLFATKEIDKATLEKKEAEYLFTEDSVAVYIEFDSPNWKVRIGDCETREAAESLRRLARKRGYPTSWIVKTKVNTFPLLPQLQEQWQESVNDEL